MTMTQLSDRTARHATPINGSAQLYYEMLTSTRDITRLTAAGPVVTTLTTHLPFSDKVTLGSGFVQEVTYDAATGVSTVSVGGIMESTAAAGSFEVTTRPAALISLEDGAAYPSAGEVQVRGRSGTLAMTVLPGEKVRLGVDEDDDGVPESSRDVAWNWLF